MQILKPDYYSVTWLMTPFFRMTVFDVHVKAVAQKIDALKLTLFTFSRIHNALVEGAGVSSYRWDSATINNIFVVFSLPILIKAQTQGTLVAGSSSGRVGRDGAKRDLGQSEVYLLQLTTDNGQLTTDNSNNIRFQGAGDAVRRD